MSAILVVLRAIPVWVWLSIAACGAIFYLNERLETVKVERDQAQDEVSTASKRIESLRQVAGLQQAIASDLGKQSSQYQEDLKNANAERAALSAGLADATKRLSVKAHYVPARVAAGNGAATSRPDGGTCELDADARSDYLDLRRGLQQQYSQIIRLQSALKDMHAKCFVAGMSQ